MTNEPNALIESATCRIADNRSMSFTTISDIIRDTVDQCATLVAREWGVARWKAEVKNRPLQNVHRRSLDDTWRQVIRHFGGDDVALCGPSHDELIRAAALKGDAKGER